MFVKITRKNESNHDKELIVDTNEIAFITQCEDKANYDKPTKFVEEVDLDTGEKINEPVEWEMEERYLIAFKNGKHPQFLDKANYETLKEILLTNKQLVEIKATGENASSLLFLFSSYLARQKRNTAVTWDQEAASIVPCYPGTAIVLIRSEKI